MRYASLIAAGLTVTLMACAPEHRGAEGPMSLSLAEVSRTPLEFEAGSTLHVHQGKPLVVDRFESQLVTLEPGKGASHRWGHKGDGPGEFQSITGVLAAPGGALWVLDVKRLVGIRLSGEGEFIKEVALPGLPLVAQATPEGGLQGVWVLGLDLFVAEVGSGSGQVLSRRDLPAALPSLLSDLPEMAPPMIGGTWTDTGTLLLAAPWRYELIEVRDDLTVVRRITRDLPPEFPSNEDLEALRESIESTLRTTSVSFPEATINRMVKDRATDPKPPISLNVIETDTAGRIWVLTTRRGDATTVIDVFSTAGDLVASVPVLGRPRALAFDRDTVFVLTRETSGSDVLVEYHVE
jgi:hypothetical protein